MYRVEEDISLMEVFDCFAKRNGNWTCKYKFIEILGRIQNEDVIYMNDIIWFEQELDIPIRFILLNSANIYIGDVEISKISDVKKYIGSRKGYKYPKLSYQGFRQLLLNQRI